MNQPQSGTPVPMIVTALIIGMAVLFGLKAALSPKPADAPGPPSTPVESVTPEPAAGETPPDDPAEEARFIRARQQMVENDLRGRDITDPRVLEVMGRVARQKFVPPSLEAKAYDDHPLPIGHGQTISQPYIVALMTQLAKTNPEAKALDIGTGSGYQAAVLAELCKEVYGIEIIEPLAEDAKQRLRRLGYGNVTVRCGDGYRGWPEHAPFDVIVVAAAAGHVPQPLVDQLAPNGRIVIPVGRSYQELLLIEKRADGSVRQQRIAAVAFVPMTGEVQNR